MTVYKDKIDRHLERLIDILRVRNTKNAILLQILWRDFMNINNIKPQILNSLINMTNSYEFSSLKSKCKRNRKCEYSYNLFRNWISWPKVLMGSICWNKVKFLNVYWRLITGKHKEGSISKLIFFFTSEFNQILKEMWQEPYTIFSENWREENISQIFSKAQQNFDIKVWQNIKKRQLKTSILHKHIHTIS